MSCTEYDRFEYAYIFWKVIIPNMYISTSPIYKDRNRGRDADVSIFFFLNHNIYTSTSTPICRYIYYSLWSAFALPDAADSMKVYLAVG